MDQTLDQHLKKIGACLAARQWAKGMRAAEAWRKCEWPGWLHWWVSRMDRGPCTLCMAGISFTDATCDQIRKIAKCPWREPRAKKAVAKINRQIQGAKV